MSQHESAEGGEVSTEPTRAVSFGRHAAQQSQIDGPVQKVLIQSLAEALQHRCFDYNVDSAWMSTTHDSWRTLMSSAIHKNGLTRRLNAATDVPTGGALKSRGQTAQPNPDTQVRRSSHLNQTTVLCMYDWYVQCQVMHVTLAQLISHPCAEASSL